MNIDLALSSARFHSRLKTEFFKRSYPDSTPSPPQSPIATITRRCLLGLISLNFNRAPKHNKKFGYCGTWFSITPMNKLVSLTSLFVVLKSLWRFTLHYILNGLLPMHLPCLRHFAHSELSLPYLTLSSVCVLWIEINAISITLN